MDFHARPRFAGAGVPDDATDDLARLNHEDKVPARAARARADDPNRKQ